jgi:hypothetical protein
MTAQEFSNVVGELTTDYQKGTITAQEFVMKLCVWNNRRSESILASKSFEVREVKATKHLKHFKL